MSEQSPKDSLPEFLKKLWLPIAGFIGAITLAYNFYKLWLGDQATVTYFLTGAGLLLLIIALAWVSFKVNTVTLTIDFPKGAKTTEKKPAFSPVLRSIARICLGIVLLVGIVGGVKYYKHRQELQDKLIVLITTFEGPEDVYGLHNQIVDSLNNEFSNNSTVKIIASSDIITPNQGSPAAHDLGHRYHADVVIWGWYRPIQNPNVTIHIENISPQLTNYIDQGSTFQPAVTLTDLESFSFQQELGGQTTALINSLLGLIRYQVRDYPTALTYFNKSIKLLENSSTTAMINLDYVYVSRGVTYFFLWQYDQAIADFTMAIKINPQNARAYINRGTTQNRLRQYDQAIADFTQAIKIDPQLAYYAYASRGITYTDLQMSDRAIADCKEAVKVGPQNADTYEMCGYIYCRLDNYDQAITFYAQAIKIDPKSANAYINRGACYDWQENYFRAIADYTHAIILDPKDSYTYVKRGEDFAWIYLHRQAIADYTQAIKLNPQNADTYNLRGISYSSLGNYDQAIADFTQAIDLDPQRAAPYCNRYKAYTALNRTAEGAADELVCYDRLPNFFR